MELFLNPISMVVGGAMVSLPIIIHLLNRMRFKRVRWAAMEFLLKSQKRNRRRLIIEQLILLLLRCLLVLLAAFLVARFVGAALGFNQNSASAHVIILDDTLSMRDRWEDAGVQRNAFERAKESLLALARHASEQSGAHYFEVYKLSSPDPVFTRARMSSEMVDRLRKQLDNVQPTFLHVAPNVGVERARKTLSEAKEGRRFLHVFSDFRERDWANGPLASDLKKNLDRIAESSMNITLIDCANPARAERKTPGGADNLAIISLKPESRVAPEGRPVKVTVEIANYGTTAVKSLFLDVFLDDALVPNLEFSRQVEPPPPGQTIKHTFEVRFNVSGYHHMEVRLKRTEKKGLQEDNSRFAVIEVRKKVPVLVVDGLPDGANKIGSDSRTVTNALESAKRYIVVRKGVEELQRSDLGKEYATIYLLNVPQIGTMPKVNGKVLKPGQELTKEVRLALKPEERRLLNLIEFVRSGGNVVFFMGEQVDKNHYNNELYENAEGLFPVPLEETKSAPLSDDKEDLFTFQPKLYVRSREHPVTTGIFPEQSQFAFLTIRHYAVTRERVQWKQELSRPEVLTELVTLPNLKSLKDYVAQTEQLLGEVPQDAAAVKEKVPALYSKLPKKEREEAFVALGNRLREHVLTIKDKLSAKEDELYLLADAIEQMLKDAGVRDRKDRPDLTAFWESATMRGLRARLDAFYRQVKFGSPLVLDRKYGDGHVVAFLTTAGSQWHNWPGGSPVSYTYPMIMSDLVRYLTSGGEVQDTFVGQTLTFKLDEREFSSEISRYKQVKRDKNAIKNENAVNGFIPDGKQQGTRKDGQFQFAFADNQTPCVRYFRAMPKAKDGAVEPQEYWYAFNVNTTAESNLSRAAYSDLERNPSAAPKERGKISLIAGDSRKVTKLLKQKSTDWSESPWLYLLFLVVLVVEQALAVHLSFHLKGSSEASAASAATGSTPTSVGSHAA